MNQETHRRFHLTKEQRLPASYKEVEKILNIVLKCEANVKTVLNNSKLRGAVLHKVSGLTFSVLKQRRILDSIIEKTQILEKEPYLRKELAGILIHELIFGNGLPGKSKPVETVLKYQNDIEKAYSDLKLDESLFNSVISIPKYVRVNTLTITLPEVLEDLEHLGVRQIIFNESISEDEFYDLIKKLEKSTFLLDFHFKDLLIFHSAENLTSWSLYQRGHVFIQDKSSYIPAYVLTPPPGAIVIDACAAPGMKTLHVTALMENDGVVFAFERDQQRFEVLNKMLKSGHASICQTSCCDFNSVNPRNEKFSSVEYILLDPSCSGSGMVNRMDNITDTEESKNDLRIQKLAGFQIILLKHALLFPSVKRVVYSTCSITETENEFVVHEVLNHFRHRFKLSPVLPDWSIRGSNNFEFGSHCLRAYPDKCFTNGFFVAMFERLEDDSVEHHFAGKQHKRESKKHNCEFKQSYLSPEDSKLDYNKKKLDSDFKNKDQCMTEERKNNITLDNIPTKEVPLKKIHKKKDKKDQFSVDEEHTKIQAEKIVSLDSGDQINNSSSTIEETKSHMKKHKSKNDKDYSKNINKNNLIVTQTLELESEDTSVQGSILFKNAENINLKHKKDKSKQRKDSHSLTNINLNDEVEEVQTLINISNEASSVVNPHKKRKKHKEKACNNSFIDTQVTLTVSVTDNTVKETTSETGVLSKKKKLKKDCNNSLCEIQNPEAVIKVYNVDDDNVTQTPREIRILNKTKKKHKIENEKDYNNSFCDTEISKVHIQDFSFINATITENLQEVKNPHKKKKSHKRKYEKGDDNSFNETQNSEEQFQNCNVENLISTEADQDVKTSHKKKKHKRMHDKESDNNSFSETQTPECCNVENLISSETYQDIDISSKKKKKHKIQEKETSNNSFSETSTPEERLQNPNIENLILTVTDQHVKTSHNEKHKRKYETENL